MQKSRVRGSVASPTPAHFMLRPPALAHSARPPTPTMHRTQPTRPEPDYEVVEFPSDQYVNAKLQPPPPTPPRPPTGHPVDAGASCGLCGGGGARVRCAECGRRALCASCDDMYHRHPKRRHHQRQALSQSQLRDDRPPLPPKVAPPVPPPRKHKIGGERMSASPKPPISDQRRATLGHMSGVMAFSQSQPGPVQRSPLHTQHQMPLHLQQKLTSMPAPAHLGSMPYLPHLQHLQTTSPAPAHGPSNTLSHPNTWNRSRGPVQGYGLQANMAVPVDAWDNADTVPPPTQSWGRPLRKGASVMELSGGGVCAGGACGACSAWRYGSCASLEHAPAWPPACCAPHHPSLHGPPSHTHPHLYPSQTPQPYRRADSRATSRAASRTGSRAASPALSMRSRTSRRTKHRTPSPPPVPSSDADSESESEDERPAPAPAPASVSAPHSAWQCEHCTYVNEPGIRVCAICCKTPTAPPKSIANDVTENMNRLNISRESSTSRVLQEPRFEKEVPKTTTKLKKERASTGCGPSPPRDRNTNNSYHRLETPTRCPTYDSRDEDVHNKHDVGVGPSPPRERHATHTSTETSPPRDASRTTIRVSPYRETKTSSTPEPPKRHSISVGPSPPRDNSKQIQKKSAGTPPPRDTLKDRRSNTSNTGTSPPPQSISTQTYEVPNSWEQAETTSRSRPRRRFRDDSRRERSHSRHSLSSDTRESERSVRTTGTGSRYEWRERDSSPGGEWEDRYGRLSRRASHLDLRRTRSTRRSSFYGSEAASPERLSNRAASLEALAGAAASREVERGTELAQLMIEAERQGFGAGEVVAALAQSPRAPLAWLRARRPALVAAVRGGVARLVPGAAPSERQARAALARHAGAVWPAVTDCVDALHRQADGAGVGEEGRVRGHVWGSPAGAEDDAAPPRSPTRASPRPRAGADSSDEFEALTPPKYEDGDWPYLPFDANVRDFDRNDDLLGNDYPLSYDLVEQTNEIDEGVTKKLTSLLLEAGVPTIDDNLLIGGLISGNAIFGSRVPSNKPQPVDLIQSENDFIDAYNALTRYSPLPNINKIHNSVNFNETPKPPNPTIFIDKSDKLNKIHNKTAETKNKRQIESNNTNNIHNEQDLLANIEEAITYTNQDKPDAAVALQPTDNDKLKKDHSTDNLENSSILYQSTIQSINSKFLENTSQPTENLVVHNNSYKKEEKSNNLTDIFDNTQKLIQQMKEEINSDINSIDGGTISQSEAEHSSSESHDGQESSLSESVDETDDISSDDKDCTSSEDDRTLDKSQASRNKTSSEDNESFQEALDHVEMDDFRNANIELLDSISRTLHEEYVLSVDKQIKSTTRRQTKQDFNNNSFVPVNSFEEIYEEINGFPAKETTNMAQTTFNDNLTEAKFKIINLIPKESITLSVFKPVIPTKLLITENKHHVLKAIYDNIQETDSEETRLDVIIVDALDNNTSENQLFNLEENRVNISNPLDKEAPKGDSIIQINELVTDTQNNLHNIYDTPSTDTLIMNTENTSTTISETTSNENPSIIKNIGNKSNIPKLIKIVPNNKTKVDKHSPKLIVSKVPIRRASIKQYPAPAPPKAHFGNIQSGHVKQLQTRLFNTGSGKPKAKPIAADKPEPKPTTSTLSKKKQAPPPPVAQQQEKPPSPVSALASPKVKKPYFRETCRTEDEWTDSESDDSQSQFIIKPSEDVRQSTPSPPPPITLRRVSGQLIDLAKVRLPEGSPERQARMLLAEGATESWEQAQLAIELISRGVEPPAALLAALECADLAAALAYLYQDCELCASKFPEHEMVSMLRCTHRCCRECAHLYFTVQITERSIADCVCPFCKMPELESLPEDSWLEYFAHLDILLKTLVENDVHELFQRKLRDRTLARDPNFRWCVECSSGFFVHPKQKRIRCPECRSISCASCRKAWSANHEGLTCEQYTAWLEDNDPERSMTAIQQHLRDNGLECPRCHFKYSLSRGGCMHFTCTQCKYEFCYGCGKPFTMGARCGLSEYCAKLGLHAHHPRNCLFYLRDKEPHELQTLLQMNNVTYETEAAEGSGGRCPVQLQRETPTGLVDGICGSEAPANYAGLCKPHYVEYLAARARTSRVDPLPVMSVPELVAELRRRALPPPERGPWDTDPIYAGMCAEMVKEKIPLD